MNNDEPKVYDIKLDIEFTKTFPIKYKFFH